MITYQQAKNKQDFEQIIALQTINLPVNISKEEAQKEGFVTLIHDVSLLEKMNTPYPHLIAKDGDDVVGYTLVMLRSLEKDIPDLAPMFTHINKMTYQGISINESTYFIMGQVCVAKSHRGKDVFAGLYRELTLQMKEDFDFIITEISLKNTRSIRAHEKVGFEVLQEYTAQDGKEWQVVIMDLRS